MQNFKLLFVLSIAVFLSACDNNNSASVDVDADEPTEEKVDNAPTESGMTSGLNNPANPAVAFSVQLDDGEKWQANIETTEGINSMMASVKEVMKSEGTDLDTYRALGESLQKDFNTIFEKCTMTGDAHEQLHNYLLPMVDLVKTFQKGDLAACKNALPELKKHLGSYTSYFE